MGAHTTELCHSTVASLTLQPAFDPVDWVYKDAVPHFPSFDIWPNFRDFTRDIQARYHRQIKRNSWHAAACEDVVVIQRCGFNSNQDITWTDLRIAIIRLVDELFLLAMFI